MQNITIAVDAMGGDHGPQVTVPASCNSLNAHPELRVTLVGDETLLKPYLSKQNFGDRLRIRHASEIIGMEDKPTDALRYKPDSSIRQSVLMVKDGDAAACVSAGNTGALLALGSFILRKCPGVLRPAICSALPTLQGHCYLLDLGATVDSSAENLYQFALMGSLLAQAVDCIETPRVALLNIGQESSKGNLQVKEASALIAANRHLNYVGYVEGDTLYDGRADVVVCDGFTGNVALKASEGVASFLEKKIKNEIRRSMLSRLFGYLAAPMLKGAYRQIDPRVFNGATFLGLQGVVVKSHGNADVYAFGFAIEQALNAVKRQVVASIDENFHAAM